MTRYIVFDKNGIVHESEDYDAAQKEYCETSKFDGDLIFAELISRRR